MIETSGSSPKSDTPCHHCGLPVGRFPVGSNPYFCCTGCETVYHVLTQSGLADTYYRLRDDSPSIGDACPAPVEPDLLLLAELDTTEFLEEYTEVVRDSLRRVRLYLDGVHCAACVWLVEKMPFELDGVRSARVDLPRGMVTIEWDVAEVSLSDIGKWLNRIGYPVQPRVQNQLEASQIEERKLLIRVGICWALAGNVMLIAFALYSGLAASNDPGLFLGARIVSLLLSVPALIIGGSVFFRRAWASIRIAVSTRSFRNLHMDTPISLGILVGFGYSVVSTFSGSGEIWFDSITILIAALLSARWIQLRSRRLAGDQTDRLLALIPTMARHLNDDGSTQLVRADSLPGNSIVEVSGGEVIPVDGSIVEGNTHLNNAILTGESLPEKVGIGDIVFAGTTNLSSAIRISVAQTGDQTRIGQLLAWISDDALAKAPVVLMADRIGGFFVVSVLLLGLLTFAGWLVIDSEFAVQHMVALLVITCPCALGMATPLALAVASGDAARRGLFVKHESAFETLTHIDCVVLDKTGTLTEGRMSVLGHRGDAEAIELAARVESGSSHPIATAIREYSDDAPNAALPIAVENVVGRGIQGSHLGKHIRVGHLDWIRSEGAHLTEDLMTYNTEVANEGSTPVAVAVEDTVRAVISISDRLRPDAKSLIESFQSKGLEIYIASGDHEQTVHHIARLLGIEESFVSGRVSPDEKRLLLKKLISEGKTVLMVGDGVNDAAALQQAQIGIAVSGSSTAGRLAADIYITAQGIESVASLIDGSTRVMRVIRHNLTFSLAYNVFGAGLAVFGLVTPLLAAVAMPISSFIVVLYSVLQRPFRHGKRSQSIVRRARHLASDYP